MALFLTAKGAEKREGRKGQLHAYTRQSTQNLLCSLPTFVTLSPMARLGDVLYFLRQIFFPNWVEREEGAEPSRWRKILAKIFLFLTSRDGTGTVFSIVLHVFILVILAFIMIPRMSNVPGIDILVDWKVPGIEHAAVIAPPNNNANGGERPQTADGSPQQEEPDEPIPVDNTSTSLAPVAVTPIQGALPNPDFTSAHLTDTQQQAVWARGGLVEGGGFQNRSAAGRQGAIQGGGSCQRGEDAVERGLAWLAAHQQSDHGWSLHLEGSCFCSHRGTSLSNRRAAATALALLPFLGAGYTHQTENPYRSHVEKGLTFLRQDLNGGYDGAAIRRDELRMYSYGLAAIALCEAYAMSREQDPASRLGIAAQRSLWIIERAQDPEYGGWNYRDQTIRDGIRDGGDTSIFAWQLMALKSGKIGGLQVSQSVLYAAQDFLDIVAIEGGRRYNYLPSGRWDNRAGNFGGDSPKTCTAMGLLMRMYLGWKPGDPFLDEGMEQLVRWGPILNENEVNLYYIYYATLALHHYGGEHWDAWNREVRELLIRTQSNRDCEAGSWFFPDRYCDVGGRLLNTSLAIMILETPYRIMPLYREIR